MLRGVGRESARNVASHSNVSVTSTARGNGRREGRESRTNGCAFQGPVIPALAVFQIISKVGDRAELVAAQASYPALEGVSGPRGRPMSFQGGWR